MCKYVDVFPDELPGLPPHRDVDFGIEWMTFDLLPVRVRARVSLEDCVTVTERPSTVH